MMSMVFSKPVLGVISGDAKELIIENNMGIVANHRPEDIAKAIDRFVKMGETEFKQMGENAKKCYNEHFSIKSVTNDIITYLKN